MLGLDYNERVAHEMQNIPLSYYYVDKKHPAYHAPLHWHRPSEIVRVLSGKLKMYLDGKMIIVMPGDILFINQEIIHGCLFLINSDFPVTEIAYRCGFNDSAYFAKVFKKYKKSTPKKYRSSLSISASKKSSENS